MGKRRRRWADDGTLEIATKEIVDAPPVWLTAAWTLDPAFCLACHMGDGKHDADCPVPKMAKEFGK